MAQFPNFSGWQAQPPEKTTLRVNSTIVTEQGETLTVNRAFANVTAGTTGDVVAGTLTGKLIRVIQVLATGGAAATTAVFKSQTGPTAITSTKNIAAYGSFTEASDHGLFQTTTAADKLQLTAGAGADVNVDVLYVLLDATLSY